MICPINPELFAMKNHLKALLEPQSIIKDDFLDKILFCIFRIFNKMTITLLIMYLFKI